LPCSLCSQILHTVQDYQYRLLRPKLDSSDPNFSAMDVSNFAHCQSFHTAIFRSVLQLVADSVAQFRFPFRSTSSGVNWKPSKTCNSYFVYANQPISSIYKRSAKTFNFLSQLLVFVLQVTNHSVTNRGCNKRSKIGHTVALNSFYVSSFDSSESVSGSKSVQ